MPGMNGLELQAVLQKNNIRMPVIIMTGHADVTTAVDSLKHDAVDYLVNPVWPEVLRACVARAIQRDAQHCEKERVRRSVMQSIKKLTPREREVLDLLAIGVDTKAIASRLGISVKTVFVHRARIMEKMAMENLVELSRTVATLRHQ